MSARQRAGLMLWALLAAAGSGFGQVSYDSATLNGTVLDPSGLAVREALVAVINPATGIRRTARSNEEGLYQISELPPGTYKATVEASGFSTAVVEQLTLTVGQTVTYDVHLVIGTMNQVLVVNYRPPLIDLEQSQQANTVNQIQVEHLPNVGRRFTDLVFTVPGIANASAPTVQDATIGTGFLSSGFSIGGSNGRNNLVTIDGGENDYGSGTPRVRNVPVESVQEFQVNRAGFAAEFGNTVGSAMNFITRSGSNRFHGSVAGYFHGQKLDSVNYFDRLINPGSRPFEQSFIPGATLGGPVRKDKLFFFSSYEYQKLDSATTQNFSRTEAFQPVSAQANGFSGGKCPGQPLQVSQLCYLTQLANSGGPLSSLGTALLGSAILGPPLADPILKALVLPNEGTFNGIISPLATVRGIPGFNTPRGRYHNWVSRVDWVPRPKDNVMVRFSLMNEKDNVAPQPPSSTYNNRVDYTITGAWTHTFHSGLVNILRMQVVPSDTSFADAPRRGGSQIDLATGRTISLGTPALVPYDARFKRFQFDEGLLWQKGKHTVKFGGTYRPFFYRVDENLWFGGQWLFTDGAIPLIALTPPEVQGALAAYNISQGYPAGGPASTNLTAVQSFLAGTPISLLQADSKSNASWSAWDQTVGFYAQDSWRASRHLTVNYGARVDYFAPPAPVPHNGFVSPRVGIAWDPAGNGKTVVRAGGGLFAAPVLFVVPFYVNSLSDSGNFIHQSALSAALPSPPFPSIFAAWATARAKATPADPNPTLTAADMASIGWTIKAPGPDAFGAFFTTMGANFKPQYSIQGSLSVARELSRNLSIEAGYTYYRNVHIQVVVEGNSQPIPCNVFNPGVYSAAVDPFVGPCYAPRPGTTGGVPNALVFQNNVFSSIGSGTYHGLTTSLQRRYGNGLQFQVHYTLSQAKDNTSDFSTLSVPFRPDQLHKDWGISYFNVTHNVSANAVYTTPFGPRAQGWRRVLADVTVAPILYARSGIPFTPFVPGLGGLTGNGTVGHNSAARPWNADRNQGRGFPFVSWDMRISKAVYLHRERGVRADLILQFQNLLNRANFAAVNNNFPADPNYRLPNGGTLLNGPYDLQGFAPTSVSQIGQTLAFTSTNPPRYVSLGLRIGF